VCCQPKHASQLIVLYTQIFYDSLCYSDGWDILRLPYVSAPDIKIVTACTWSEFISRNLAFRSTLSGCPIDLSDYICSILQVVCLTSLTFLSLVISMSTILRDTVFYGAVINPRTLSNYQASPNCLLSVSPSGDIDWLEDSVEDSEVQDILLRHGCLDADLVILKHGEFIMPGFVDTHTVRCCCSFCLYIIR